MAVAALLLREERRGAGRLATIQTGALLGRFGPALLAYSGAQLLVLTLAGIEASLTHASLAGELTRWDGQWYLNLARHGYPSSIPNAASTLGFMPGYPIVIRAIQALFSLPALPAALLLARAGGLVSTLLVQQLTSSWWGDQAGRRAAVLYALFPGAVVFSMAYSDGLFLALVLACMLALERRRWLAAGVLGAGAGATGADGTVLVLAVTVAALVHLVRSRAWDNRSELRCLAAPLFCPLGLAGVGAYMWARVGSPWAVMETQCRFWGNRVSPLATLHHYELYLQFGGRNLNLLIGLLGVPFVIGTRYLILRADTRPPAWALMWGFGVTLACLGSSGLTPNPRMLLLAFPSGVVLARFLRGRAFLAVVAASTLGLGLVSWWTLGGHILP
ncbi:MAG: mannosyltransferase family protein [Acidimicrobiales bacterium]